MVGTSGVTGNTILVDGGGGQDTAGLFYGDFTDDLVFNFSDGYSQRVEAGIRLLRIDRVEVTGGTGDDEFQGGDGDDVFDGGDGRDTVVLDGVASDYEIFEAEFGGTQVIDLRPGSPGGTDLYLNVEAFAFGGDMSDLA